MTVFWNAFWLVVGAGALALIAVMNVRHAAAGADPSVFIFNTVFAAIFGVVVYRELRDLLKAALEMLEGEGR